MKASQETIEQKRERIAEAKRRIKKGLPPKPRGRRIAFVPPKPTRAVELPDLGAYDLMRLWSLIRRGKPDECWPWKGARTGFGHGRFKVEGRLYSPHRLIYQAEIGRIENAAEHHGSVVMHACDNPWCCNPAHLRLGTQLDNVEDMCAKGRLHSNLPPRPVARLLVPAGTQSVRATLPALHGGL